MAEPLAAFTGRLLAKKPADRFVNAKACLTAFHSAIDLPKPAETAVIRESYLQAAFVGRPEELALFDNALNSTLDGHGQGILIRGESGVGKTRCSMRCGFGLW